MTASTIVLAFAAALYVGAPTSSAGSSHTATGGRTTFRFVETGKPHATNWAVAGVGRFRASGAITDSGKSTSYRNDLPTKTLIRRVLVGKKGQITILVTISKTARTKHWTITGATNGYKGLHGSGTEPSATFSGNTVAATLVGTVSR